VNPDWLEHFRAWVRRHRHELGHQSAVIRVNGRTWCVPETASVTNGASYVTENTVQDGVPEAA
jgi:hypothetical protein